jgi:hypothetical protein
VLTLREDIEEGEGKAGPLEEFIQSLKDRADLSEEEKRHAIDLMRSYLTSIPQKPAPTVYGSERITLNLPHRVYESIHRPHIGQVVSLELKVQETG